MLVKMKWRSNSPLLGQSRILTYFPIRAHPAPLKLPAAAWPITADRNLHGWRGASPHTAQILRRQSQSSASLAMWDSLALFIHKRQI
jgi:hypothetical protein